MKVFWRRARPHSWLDWLAMVGLLAIFAAASLLIYWIHFQDNPPLVVNNDPLPVVSEQAVYQPGDVIRFEINFCRRSAGEITRTRRWIDGLMYVEPPLTLAGGNRECVKTVLVATVPQIPPGRYYVEYDLSYKINPLRTRLVVFRTDYFTVVND